MTTIDIKQKPAAINGHSVELEKLVQDLDSNLEKGLSQEKAQQKLEEFGLNVIPKPKQSFWQVREVYWNYTLQDSERR